MSSDVRLGPLRIGAETTPGKLVRLVRDTFDTAFQYRALGLAAEAAFFCVLSVPPLIFGLAGTIGFFIQRLNVVEISQLRDQILDLASAFLAPDVIQQVIAPTLEDVISGGRADIISIGFLLALWTGSRAANVFIDTISIMYGQARKRSIVRTRLLSIGLYAALLLLATFLLPLVLAGPSLIVRLLPARLEFLTSFYWPIVVLGSIVLLATVLHRSVPVRPRWRAALPGAAFTMLTWLVGSWLLRYSLEVAVGSTTIYGPLAAPIALLLWLYVIAAALLIGAALNAAAARVWPGLLSDAD